MNIFILDLDPELCAQYHCDKHVVKMILETAQLLSTAHHVLDGPRSDLYKPTHVNHPCAVWLRESVANYMWTYSLFRELSREYTYRYGKDHKSWILLGDILSSPPANIPDCGPTPMALAMPDKYKCPFPVHAYRDYYCGDKARMLKWTKRETPPWVDPS